MNDAICPNCGNDNLTDYPVCDTCATVAHFTHRDRCLHCERKHAAAMQRIQIAADIASALLCELVAAGIDDPQLARVRLHSLAGRAAELLATMEGTK